MKISGLANFLRPPLSRQRNNEEIQFNTKIRTSSKGLVSPRPNPSKLLFDSFVFKSNQVPNINNLSGPLSAFRLTESGRFLTNKFQKSKLPIIENFEKKSRFLEIKTDSIENIKTRLQKLKETISEINRPQKFNLLGNSSNPPEILGIKTGSQSPLTEFKVSINQLASGSVLVSDQQIKSSLGLSGSFRINGTEVKISTSDTLFDIKNKINLGEDLNNNGQLDPKEDFNNNGVAEILEIEGNEFSEGFYLNEDLNGNGLLDPKEDSNNNGQLDGGTINSQVTATIQKNRLVLTSIAGESTSISLEDSDGILLTLGFFETTPSGSTVLKEVQLDFPKNPVTNLNQQPKQAEIEFNGKKNLSNSNEFKNIIDDTTLSLKNSSNEEILGKIFLDIQSGVQQIKTFFESFNSSIVALNDSLLGFNKLATDLDFQKLRKELTQNPKNQINKNKNQAENQKSVSPHLNNSKSLGLEVSEDENSKISEIAVSQFVNTIRSGLQLPFANTGNHLFRKLSTIGIRTQEDSTFKIDTQTLEKALKKNPKEVLDLFTNSKTGIFNSLEKQLNKVLAENSGILEFKKDLIESIYGFSETHSETFETAEHNRTVGLQFRNLITVA